MTHHEHTANAASTPKTGLSALLRGLFRVQGNSAPFVGQGTGASSRARLATLATLVALAGMLGVLAFAASPTWAFESHNLEGGFGPDGTVATHFERPASVAVDQSTGNIYVGDPYPDETVQKFDAADDPEPFTGISPGIVGGRLTGFRVILMPQIAVNSTSHDLYVENGDSEVVEAVRAYQADGEPADFTAGPDAGTNEITGSEVCGVAVDASGDIYVSEFATGVRVFAPSGAPLPSIASSGLCSLAVNSDGTVYAKAPESPGVGNAGPVQEFTPSEFPVTLSTTYSEAGTLDTNPAFAVAIDPSTDHVYVDEGSQVAEYDAAGVRLGSFGTSGAGRYAAGLAIYGVTGQVYLAQGGGGEGQVEVFGPAILLPNVSTVKASAINPKGTATLNGAVNPEGVALSECQFEYVEEAHYEVTASDSYAAGATAPCVPAAAAIPTGEETQVHADVTGLIPGVTYHYRLRASNKTALNSNPSNFGSDETFSMPPKPAISGGSTANLAKESVDLSAQINPGGLEVEECKFEYGAGASYGKEAPCVPATIPAGTQPVAVTAHLENLEANREYHWRVVATTEAGTTAGVDHTFVYATGGEALAGNRAYEMVTPPQKNGALVAYASVGGLRPSISEDGSRVMAMSIQCFANAEACTVIRSTGGSVGQPYLFTRTSTGWVTTALQPPASEFPIDSDWLFDADTETALFSMPTAPMFEDDFYVRSAGNSGEPPAGTFTDIGPLTPSSQGEQTPHYGSEGADMVATSDFSHLAYEYQESAYQFSGTGNTERTPVGVSGGSSSGDLISACATSLSSAPGEMSADGATVYFTAGACPAGGTGVNAGREVPVNELFARVDGGEAAAHTVSISQPEALSPSAPGVYKGYEGCTSPACVGATENPEPPAASNPAWRDAGFAGASADGSKAFFTSEQQLTDSATQGSSNLYEYDFDNSATEGDLVDVSAGDVSGQEPGVQGVVAISADGSHVYFVAKGVLGTAANDQGQTAQSGANNLYVFTREAADPRGQVAFIAQLPQSDEELWRFNNERGTANVTPEGRFLVFESYGRLTPDTTGANAATQIFRYDAGSGSHPPEMVRISIGEHGFNDNGNAGIAGIGGAHIVPPSRRGSQQAGPLRLDPTMSNDGAYIFFESPIGLTTHALNDVPIGRTSNGDYEEYAENVYEYHEGNVYLISDGRDVTSGRTICSIYSLTLSSVCLLGSDTSGSNVFFTTADSLVPKDIDTQLDIYDARICEPENGNPCISEPSSPLPPCDGENCHGVPAATPSLLTPGSASFNGEGNVPPKSPAPAVKAKAKVVKCKKGLTRNKRGKCVKRKKKKKSKKTKRSSYDRRAE